MKVQEAKEKCIQSVDFETEELENIVIEALEKQIPKKPIEDGCLILCPICKASVDWKRYCEDCGQKIDWGNEDD